MKIIKSLFIAGCVVTSTLAFSQEAASKKDPKVAEMRAQKSCEKWTGDLNLSEVQKKAALQIFLDKAKQGDIDKASCKEDAACLEQKKTERNRTAEKGLQAILSNEQYIKFQQKKKKTIHDEVMRKESGEPVNNSPESEETF